MERSARRSRSGSWPPLGIIRTGFGDLLLAAPALDNMENLQATMHDLLMVTRERHWAVAGPGGTEKEESA